MDIIFNFSWLTPSHWFGLAVILITIEVIMGANFFLIWIGCAALVVTVIYWLIPGITWQIQFIIFAIAATTSILFWHFYLKNNLTRSNKPSLNKRNEQYINRIITLEEPIVNGRGRVSIDNSIWRVEGEDLAAGLKIKVIAVDGVILKVKKFD